MDSFREVLAAAGFSWGSLMGRAKAGEPGEVNPNTAMIENVTTSLFIIGRGRCKAHISNLTICRHITRAKDPNNMVLT